MAKKLPVKDENGVAMRKAFDALEKKFLAVSGAAVAVTSGCLASDTIAGKGKYIVSKRLVDKLVTELTKAGLVSYPA